MQARSMEPCISSFNIMGGTNKLGYPSEIRVIRIGVGDWRLGGGDKTVCKLSDLCATDSVETQIYL